MQDWLHGGATCIDCKIFHQMAPLLLVANSATNWRYLHCLKILVPNRATYIATLPRIVLLASSLSIELKFHQPESHEVTLSTIMA